MIRQADDWGEHAGIVEAAWPNTNRTGYSYERRIEASERYLKDGFRDWFLEDGNDQDVKVGGNGVKMSEIAKAAMNAVKPVRMTMVVHSRGTGVALKTRRKVILDKLKKHVWFYNGSEADQDEVSRNTSRGMPPKLVSLLYGLSQSKANELSKQFGFKLDSVRSMCNE